MNICEKTGKYIYESEKKAKRVRNTRAKEAGNLRVYRCNECFGWHLTKAFYKVRFFKGEK